MNYFETTIESEEPSFESVICKRPLKRQFTRERDSEGTQTAEITTPSVEQKICKNIQKGSPASNRFTYNRSAERIIPAGNCEIGIQYAVSNQFDQFNLALPRNPPPHTFDKPQHGGNFDQLHRAMAPNPSKDAPGIVLADKPKSKCPGCFKSCLSKKKKKKLAEEEKKTLRETDLDSMFVPLAKTSDTSAAMRTNQHHGGSPVQKNARTKEQEKAHGKHGKQGKEVAIDTHGSTQTKEQGKAHGKHGKQGREVAIDTHGSDTVNDRQVAHQAGPSTSSTAPAYVTPSLSKSCCYLCVENSMGLSANPESVGTFGGPKYRRNKGIQISIETYRTPKGTCDKSCNPVPRVRTIRASVFVAKRDRCTQMQTAQCGKSPCVKKKVKSRCPGQCTLPTDAEKIKCPR